MNRFLENRKYKTCIVEIKGTGDTINVLGQNADILKGKRIIGVTCTQQAFPSPGNQSVTSNAYLSIYDTKNTVIYDRLPFVLFRNSNEDVSFFFPINVENINVSSSKVEFPQSQPLTIGFSVVLVFAYEDIV